MGLPSEKPAFRCLRAGSRAASVWQRVLPIGFAGLNAGDLWPRRWEPPGSGGCATQKEPPQPRWTGLLPCVVQPPERWGKSWPPVCFGSSDDCRSRTFRWSFALDTPSYCLRLTSRGKNFNGADCSLGMDEYPTWGAALTQFQPQLTE